ncbi:MAG TPA: carboxypeptidase regulatory-like domain-containing protein [Myxococcaceae bacterium]|jgi:plastocyanin
MFSRPRTALLAAILLALPARAAPPPEASIAQMPVPMVVRTPEDKTFQSAAERQYLIFNLLASGRLAYDRGDMVTAASQWEELLRIPGLPMELEAVVKPLATEAREKASGKVDPLPMPPPPQGFSKLPAPAPEVKKALVEKTRPAKPSLKAQVEPRTPATPMGTLQGTVQGGPGGAGGAVVWLTRADGPTPKPKAAPKQTVVQRGKRFLPHVLAVPVGTEVVFLNEDKMFHNVFSLSKPNDFDLGLYEKGIARSQRFDKPGVVRLLCNIHSSMSAFVYVVDSPWYTQADAKGQFTLRGVPPGEYMLHAWHEGSARPSLQPVTVSEGVLTVSATVTADAERSTFVPDKAGKPRQPQLGY